MTFFQLKYSLLYQKYGQDTRLEVLNNNSVLMIEIIGNQIYNNIETTILV